MFLIVLSFFLLMGSLWQLEIIQKYMREGQDWFDFPFHVWKMDIWSARDLMYVGLFSSWLLMLVEVSL